MRPLLVRLVTLGTVIALIAGCDQRSITTAPPGGTGGTGGTGGSGNTGAAPDVRIESPEEGARANLGDSILVAVRVRDAAGLRSLTIEGLSIRGNPDLGTPKVATRYTAPPAPAPGGTAIRTGAIDTVIRRYLQPATPLDTVLDSVVVRAIATNVNGAVDTAFRSVRIVAGPKVVLVSPVPADSVQRGVSLAMQVHAEDGDGVAEIIVDVKGETNWPTKLDTVIPVQIAGTRRQIDTTISVIVPADAPRNPRGKITIAARARDVNRDFGYAAPVVVFIRGTPPVAPLVTQVVPARLEITDSVLIAASGDGIQHVGFIVRDSLGTVIATRDSLTDVGSPRRVSLGLDLDYRHQGRRVIVSSYAVDRNGLKGYSVPATVTLPQTDSTRAFSDSVLVVHGRTFTLPRAGTAGDVAVDTVRQRVFVSNTDFNLLEVWSATTDSFAPSGVKVGSFPWGLAFSTQNSAELLVANSGGTNISKVRIDAEPASMAETGRILTRNTYLFVVTESRDETTGKIKFSAVGPISYSDRPQYIAQSRGGRIYYSTRPTTFAPAGTIRWLDPSLQQPDPRQVWQYAQGSTSSPTTFVLFNVDSLQIYTFGANSPKSDILRVWDHPYGKSTGLVDRADTTVAGVVAQMIPDSSDVEARNDVNVGALALTDTTFVAISGDKQWVAFGEGNTLGAPSRMLLVNDTLQAGGDFNKLYFSPRVTSQDIMENAAEPLFGLALDRTGKLLAAHGRQAYLSAVEQPFHLRLQGKYDSFDSGAGIAFHPLASVDPALPPAPGDNSALAFVASANGTIEIVDAYYYRSRGRINTKGNLYGPLRVTGRFPADPPDVVLKLFGMSTRGLVVINVTAGDIRP
ncbi:MAG: YncE family protein [Gemmatimonadaceae bacterium]